jgi:hypothetical protein
MTQFLGMIFDIPAIVLIALLFVGAFVMHYAQRQPDFNFALMLTDDNGKPSAMRLAVFVCLAASTWVIIKVTMSESPLPEKFNFYVAYIAIWSGAKIVEKLLDVLVAKFGGNK